MSYHQPTTPELSVGALAKWLRTQNPRDTYLYQDPARCLLGYYFTSQGAIDAISEAAYETMGQNYRTIAEPKPHTFRAALARAEQLLALPAPTPAFDPPRVEQGEPAPAEGPDR